MAAASSQKLPNVNSSPQGIIMANQSVGQAILAVLESDLLTAAGGPLLAFLQSTKANPSPMNFAAQWVALQGAVVGQLPSFEATVAQQIITVLQAKLQAAITAAQAAAAAPSA
jgi:hypothetical protein